MQTTISPSSTLKDIIIGDSLEVKFRFINAETKIPLDITGWILYWTFKPDKNMTDQNPRAVVQKIVLSVADVLGLKYKNLDGVNGLVTLRLSPELTNKFIEGKLYWDLQRVIPIRNSANELKDHDVITYHRGECLATYHVTKTYLEGPLIL
jgi:hypothetical protein